MAQSLPRLFLNWVDLGGLYQDIKDIAFALFIPRKEKLDYYSRIGASAFNKGDWLTSIHSLEAAAKLTTDPDDSALFSTLEAYAKDRLLGQPARPIDPALREKARTYNVLLPGGTA